MAPRSGPRDFLPAPLIEPLTSLHDRSSRKAKQRHGRRECVRHLANACLNSLNELATGQPDSSPPTSGRPAHQWLHQHVLNHCADLGPPPSDLTPAEASEELRGAGIYDDPASTVRPFDSSLVSLPEAGSRPVPLADLYGTGGCDFVKGFISDSLLETGAVAEQLKSAPRKAYMDPILSGSPKVYAKFIRRLFEAGMISFSKTYVEQVGMFFVVKSCNKNN